MVLILYYTLGSQPCRAIFMLLQKHGIPFEKKLINFAKREQKTPEFLAMNPLGKVPVLQDTERNFILTESVAILKYICDNYEVVDDHWYPRSMVKRAKVDEYCAWQHMGIRFPCSVVFLNEILFVGKLSNRGDIVGEMNTAIQTLEDVFLGDKTFITGSEITIADLLASCELLQPTSSGRDVLKNHPRLQKWMERVREEMNPYFDDAHEIIYSLRDAALEKIKMDKL